MIWTWKVWTVIGGAALAITAVIASGAADKLTEAIGEALGLTETQNECRRAIRRVAIAQGVDPDWIDAIAHVESNWNPTAVNNTGADAARGGSYGCLQLSMATAQSAGFTGQSQDLLDPSTVALYFCKIQKGRPGGLADSLEDMCAYWNAGKLTADDPKLPSSTKNDYIPRAVAALESIQNAENESGNA